MSLEGTYPILIDGALAGSLTVTAAGGRTAFSAVCRQLDGVVRISVYGGGREGYLGVLAPEGGGLALRRTLSRAALRDFPAEIAAVGRSGAQPEEPAAPEPAAPEPEQVSAGSPAPETPEEAEELHWYSSPDGALVCFDGTHSLIALPAGDERIPADVPGSPREIAGRAYLVYRTRNGRIER